MAKLKKFLLYAVMIAAFWIFSDIIIYLAVNTAYKNIDTRVYMSSPEIIVGESKATYVNGFVKGSIKNDNEGIINEKYLKIELYSARDVKLGTKYVEIENLETNKYQNFEMWYKFTDVDYAIISITDDISYASETEFMSEKVATYLLFGTVLVLYFL